MVALVSGKPMRRTRANDCRFLPFESARVFAALLDFDSYSLWWPAEFHVRALRSAAEHVGSRIEVRPWGGRFVCEIAEVVHDREIRIAYVDGVHRGTGVWTLEKLPEGTRACYRIDLVPHGWLVRLLSNLLDFGKMHSRSMAQVFDGLEDWLRNGRANSSRLPK